MVASKCFAGDGDVFAFAVACARRLRKIDGASWPEDVFSASHHVHDVGLQILVSGEWNRVFKLVVAAKLGETVFLSVFGVAGCLE